MEIKKNEVYTLDGRLFKAYKPHLNLFIELDIDLTEKTMTLYGKKKHSVVRIIRTRKNELEKYVCN